MKSIQGFTLIEALISLVIFAFISVFIFSTFFSSVQLNNQAQKQINTSSQAQQIMETIRSAWSVPNASGSSNYDYACVPNFVLPAGYTAQFYNLSSRAELVNGSNVVVTTATPTPIKFPSTSTTLTVCSSSTVASNNTITPAGGSAVPPTMRRVEVFSGTGSQDTKLTLDILDPQ